MNALKYLGLLLKGKKVMDEAQKAAHAGTLNQALRGLLHILALAAPIAGAVLFEEIAKAMQSSHDHLYQALGAFLFTLIPLVRRFGSPSDRGKGTPPV